MTKIDKMTKFYVAVSIVGIAGAVGAYFFRDNQVLSLLLGLTSPSALFSMLFQIFRDQAAHERKLAQQDHRHEFELAATSHMAKRVFDKHVEFCEEYYEKVIHCLKILWSDGEQAATVELSMSLRDIRVRYSLWIDRTLDTKLRKMEKDVAQIELDQKSPNPERQMNALRRYCSVLEIPMSESDRSHKPETPLPSAIKHLRDMLDVEPLIEKRKELVQSLRSQQCQKQ